MGATAPGSASVSPCTGRRPAITISLEGQVTPASLAASLAAIEDTVPPATESFDLIVDCHAMTGYESTARTGVVEWLRSHQKQIRVVAILARSYSLCVAVQMGGSFGTFTRSGTTYAQ